MNNKFVNYTDYYKYNGEEESETEDGSGGSEDDSSEKESSDDEEWIDGMIDEQKKYIDAELKIRTRNPPKALANVMKLLTNEQLNSSKDMGFKSFAGYKISRFPTALARWLLLNYNPVTSVLHAGDVNIKITSQTVHDIFGLPIGGDEIEELNQAKKTDAVIDEWRKQFHGSNDTIKPNTVAKQILERKDDAGRIFKLNFLVLFVTEMMASTACGTVNQKFLTCLKEDTDIKKLDWCAYFVKCLKETRKEWKGGAYNGPSTFVTVLYAQSLKPIVVKRSTSAIITKWTTRKLILFQKETIAAHQTLKNSEVNRTPIKDRMTRKKILSAKAVNDDDTTGIDNNKHDDAQEIISGLTKKIMLFDDYVNGIDCELEKGIQKHPGNKEIENLKLLWKQKLVKKLSEMNEKGSEPVCEEVAVDSGMEAVEHETRKETERHKEMEGDKETEGNKETEAVFQKSDAQKNIDDQHGASGLKDKDLQNNSKCTDWEKHSKISALTPITLSSFDVQLDPGKDASTEKEPSSELVPFDGSSSDMSLTSTPQGMSTMIR